ncbi:MAG TPA: hypothetical protein VGF04_04395 [Solirubrobacterales bacterium]
MSRRLATVAGLTAAVALWIAPQAGATITSSQITSPSDLTYSIYDLDNPDTIAVSGTTNSDNPSTDQVDLDCFHGGTWSTLANQVPLESDGSFSLPDADPFGLRLEVCHLRAVPSGTPPENLAPFAGPVLATGSRQSYLISDGPNDGTQYDYDIWGQQLTAANEYDSAGDCGLVDGYLFDSSLEQTTVTWYCADWYWWYENYGNEEASTRSQIKVDGANALTPYTARDLNEGGSGLPAVSYDYSLDPATGDLTITESNPIVKCGNASFPPDETKCASFVGTGVRLNRTITQGNDGHLVFITDNWMSTDGGSHSIDLLPQNDQCFNEDCPESEVQDKFPGETSYSSHEEGDVVQFSDSAPAAVYVKVAGAPDGETSTGRGAIVFDRPASPATFNSVGYDSEFYFHQTGTSTPACPATFRFAYAQDYDNADVQALAQTALSRFATPVTCPGPNPSPTVPVGHTGKRKRALRKCKRNFKKAVKKKRARHRLSKHAKKHLKKKFKKCKRRARKLPA